MAHSTASAGRMARTAGRTAEGPGLEMLARLGYIAKGVVYLIIGAIAARVAVGDGAHTTDNKGALQAIYQAPFGRFLLIVVGIGLVGYGIWCFLRAIFDADQRGSDAKGVVARVAFAIVGVAYLALAAGAFRLLAGSGSAGKSSDASTQDYTAKLLSHSYGEALVILLGVIVIGVALYLLYYAYTAQFMQRFSGMSQTIRTWVQRAGRAGYAAQGVVLGEVGVFLIIAAQRHDPHQAKGIGGALQQLAHEPYGQVLLAIVAIGLIIYGLFSFAQARYRRVATNVI